MKNIFIEGVQGSGKTTLMRALYKNLDGYQMYLEGDYSPVDLAWCSYMTKEQYQQALAKFPELVPEIEKYTVKEDKYYVVAYTRILAESREFYQYMEQFEVYNGKRSFEELKGIILRRFECFHGIGNLFECAFFQNIIEELLLFYCKTEEEIIDFYRDLFGVMKHKDFVVLYLCSEDIKGDILRIKEERADETGVEMWYPLMMNYLNDSPYGRKFEFGGAEDMAAHFRKRMGIELKIVKEVLVGYSVVIAGKGYEVEAVVNQVKQLQ